jgi:putative membrane protein
MRIFYLLVLLVVVVFGVSFAIENREPVQFHYFVGSAEVALAWLLVLTLVLGALLGMLASLGVILRLRRDVHVHRRRVSALEKELERRPEGASQETHVGGGQHG